MIDSVTTTDSVSSNTWRTYEGEFTRTGIRVSFNPRFTMGDEMDAPVNRRQAPS